MFSPDRVQLRLVDQGPHVDTFVEAGPDAEVAQPSLDLFDELVEDGLLNQQLGAGRADLEN